jgi:hypothetical protein
LRQLINGLAAMLRAMRVADFWLRSKRGTHLRLKRPCVSTSAMLAALSSIRIDNSPRSDGLPASSQTALVILQAQCTGWSAGGVRSLAQA